MSINRLKFFFDNGNEARKKEPSCVEISSQVPNPLSDEDILRRLSNKIKSNFPDPVQEGLEKYFENLKTEIEESFKTIIEDEKISQIQIRNFNAAFSGKLKDHALESYELQSRNLKFLKEKFLSLGDDTKAKALIANLILESYFHSPKAFLTLLREPATENETNFLNKFKAYLKTVNGRKIALPTKEIIDSVLRNLEQYHLESKVNIINNIQIFFKSSTISDTTEYMSKLLMKSTNQLLENFEELKNKFHTLTNENLGGNLIDNHFMLGKEYERLKSKITASTIVKTDFLQSLINKALEKKPSLAKSINLSLLQSYDRCLKATQYLKIIQKFDKSFTEMPFNVDNFYDTLKNINKIIKKMNSETKESYYNSLNNILAKLIKTETEAKSINGTIKILKKLDENKCLELMRKILNSALKKTLPIPTQKYLLNSLENDQEFTNQVIKEIKDPNAKTSLLSWIFEISRIKIQEAEDKAQEKVFKNKNENYDNEELSKRSYTLKNKFLTSNESSLRLNFIKKLLESDLQTRILEKIPKIKMNNFDIFEVICACFDPQKDSKLKDNFARYLYERNIDIRDDYQTKVDDQYDSYYYMFLNYLFNLGNSVNNN